MQETIRSVKHRFNALNPARNAKFPERLSLGEFSALLRLTAITPRQNILHFVGFCCRMGGEMTKAIRQGAEWSQHPTPLCRRAPSHTAEELCTTPILPNTPTIRKHEMGLCVASGGVGIKNPAPFLLSRRSGLRGNGFVPLQAQPLSLIGSYTRRNIKWVLCAVES